MLFTFISACKSDSSSPRNVLNRYFTGAIKQDYAAQYSCYYNASRARISKDDHICHRGDASMLLNYSINKNVYLLKKGAVKITKLTPQGNEIILDIFLGGSMFREMSVIDPQERDESAVVVENGLLYIMKKEDFERLIQMVPGLAIRLSKMIGLKRWKIENKLLDLLYRTVEQRLAKTFLNLLEDFGVPHKNGYLLQIRLTHKDYADLIASTRETVTATLKK